jgi:hypothetical protein
MNDAGKPRRVHRQQADAHRDYAEPVEASLLAMAQGSLGLAHRRLQLRLPLPTISA